MQAQEVGADPSCSFYPCCSLAFLCGGSRPPSDELLSFIFASCSFKIFSAGFFCICGQATMEVWEVLTEPFKVPRDRVSLLQRFVVRLSSSYSCVQFNNKCIFCSKCLQFSPPIHHFLLTFVNTLTVVTALLVPAWTGQQPIIRHSHTHTEGHFSLQAASRAVECHRVVICPAV